MFEFNSKVKNIFGLEIPVEITENYSCVLKDYWGDALASPVKLFDAAQKKALELECSFLSLYFNSIEPQDTDKQALLNKYKKILGEILAICKIPLMIKLSANANWDVEILQALTGVLDREVIISPVQALNYKEIIRLTRGSGFNHYFVMRTPIDINLTKELNILSIDEGVEKNRILIDPDMGCIGYGIDYGYSIIERICLARKGGDSMLDMPIIVYAGEESYRAKESKSCDFLPSWGDLEPRAKMWEISTAASLVAAGANAVVCWHPQVVKVLKRELCEVVCH